MIQQMLAIWSLIPLPFLNPGWTSGSSRFTYCWSLAWNFDHYFTSMWDECNCAVVWAFFGIAFLWDWNENWPLPVLWPLLRFPNLLACWVQHFHSIIFTLTIRKFHKTFPIYFSATSSATQSVQPQLKFPNILILLTHSFIKCEWVITAEHPANHSRIWGSGRKQPTAKNPFLWRLLIHREK